MPPLIVVTPYNPGPSTTAGAEQVIYLGTAFSPVPPAMAAMSDSWFATLHRQNSNNRLVLTLSERTGPETITSPQDSDIVWPGFSGTPQALALCALSSTVVMGIFNDADNRLVVGTRVGSSWVPSLSSATKITPNPGAIIGDIGAIAPILPTPTSNVLVIGERNVARDQFLEIYNTTPTQVAAAADWTSTGNPSAGQLVPITDDFYLYGYVKSSLTYARIIQTNGATFGGVGTPWGTETQLSASLQTPGTASKLRFAVLSPTFAIAAFAQSSPSANVLTLIPLTLNTGTQTITPGTPFVSTETALNVEILPLTTNSAVVYRYEGGPGIQVQKVTWTGATFTEGSSVPTIVQGNNYMTGAVLDSTSQVIVANDTDNASPFQLMGVVTTVT